MFVPNVQYYIFYVSEVINIGVNVTMWVLINEDNNEWRIDLVTSCKNWHYRIRIRKQLRDNELIILYPKGF